MEKSFIHSFMGQYVSLSYSQNSSTVLQDAPDNPYKTPYQRPLWSILILPSLQLLSLESSPFRSGSPIKVFARFFTNLTWAVRLIRLISLDLITAVQFADSTSHKAPQYEMLHTTATSSLLFSNVLVSIMFTKFAGMRKTDIRLWTKFTNRTRLISTRFKETLFKTSPLGGFYFVIIIMFMKG